MYCCNASWEIVGNGVRSWWWGTYFITCPPLPLVWCLCDHTLIYVIGQKLLYQLVISHASAWLLFVFISRFKALLFCGLLETFFTYLFCRFDFYLILFQSEAIRQFHWKIPFTLLANGLCLSSWPFLRRPHFKVKCSTTFLTETEAIGMFYRYPKLNVPH